MDVLVLLEHCDDADPVARHSLVAAGTGVRPLAYVHSAPDASVGDRLFGARAGGFGREVVTLCGTPHADLLALALAAAVEGRRSAAGRSAVVRHLGVWAGRGASGDAAWRDRASGQVVSHDITIDAATLEATARQLLIDCGRVIQRTVAELSTPDWPEDTRRAISFTLPVPGDGAFWGVAWAGDDELLASLREADGHDGYHAYDDAD